MLGKITRGRHTDNPSGCHSIQTNQQSTSMNPPLHQMPFLSQPSQFILAWDRHQICWLAYPLACEETKDIFVYGTGTGICWIAYPRGLVAYPHGLVPLHLLQPFSRTTRVSQCQKNSSGLHGPLHHKVQNSSGTGLPK